MSRVFSLTVANPRETPPQGSKVINVTSHSVVWQRELSPFLLGPVELYGGFQAKNVENAWQYSKVYRSFLTESGKFRPEYWTWAQKGWGDPQAHRYPAGKGAIPVFSFWNGERLPYIEARKKIYLPLYAKAVVRTKAFEILQNLVSTHPVTLVDFDVYAPGTKDLAGSLNDPNRKFGHGFVLYGLLTGEITPEGIMKTPSRDNGAESRQKPVRSFRGLFPEFSPDER